MILQNITFGFILKHILGNDPGKAITFAGVFLLIAASATLLIKVVKTDPDDGIMPVGGGH